MNEIGATGGSLEATVFILSLSNLDAPQSIIQWLVNGSITPLLPHSPYKRRLTFLEKSLAHSQHSSIL
ncbi:hypothetical protein RHMOL_Rhmol06G0238200 [Rhododendron molle]|uniref:Uncharacterized protein n=1 Tax=Rhododendron molle TaxID=49168 RepID=A0ACC0NGQ7_RHOML|nr:hypothetical protein RHMOL_Rhmol06G0238200 [Rhododendron molle]